MERPRVVFRQIPWYTMLQKKRNNSHILKDIQNRIKQERDNDRE